MGLTFGTDEKIECIRDLRMTGPNDEQLCIAHKHSTLFMGLGVSVSDDGYVLGLKGDSTQFYPMPTGRELNDLQEEGVLPKPLPPYSISTVDYAMGYSMWVFIGLAVLFYSVKLLLTALRPRHVPTSGATGGASDEGVAREPAE